MIQVLETCVKNCGKRFHQQITSKDFIQDLIKLIGPKNDPPPALQEKVLNLIQSWADAFRSQPDLSGVYHIYLDLKAKGIEFPAQDFDAMAPIHTPQRSSLASSPPRSSSGTPLRNPTAASNTASSPPSNARNNNATVAPSGPIRLTPDQLEKLNHELGIVQGNIAVFEDMLNELTPGQEHADDHELLTELNHTCRGMQQRIMELIDSVLNEDVTIELLRINDSLNNTFVRYDRFCKKRSKGSSSLSPLVSSPSSIQPQFPQTRAQESSSLIDLDDLLSGGPSPPPSSSTATSMEPQLLTSFANMAVAAGKGGRPVSTHSGDEFDAFAHSRSGVPGTNGSSSAAAASASYGAQSGEQSEGSLGSLVQSRPLRDLEGAGLIDRREDLDEMEQWMKEQESGAVASASGTSSSNKPDTKPTATYTITSKTTADNSDFERFLYERAVTSDNLPPPSSTSSSSASQSTRQQQKKQQPESDPFGL